MTQKITQHPKPTQRPLSNHSCPLTDIFYPNCLACCVISMWATGRGYPEIWSMFSLICGCHATLSLLYILGSGCCMECSFALVLECMMANRLTLNPEKALLLGGLLEKLGDNHHRLDEATFYLGTVCIIWVCSYIWSFLWNKRFLLCPGQPSTNPGWSPSYTPTLMWSLWVLLHWQKTQPISGANKMQS